MWAASINSSNCIPNTHYQMRYCSKNPFMCASRLDPCASLAVIQQETWKKYTVWVGVYFTYQKYYFGTMWQKMDEKINKWLIPYTSAFLLSTIWCQFHQQLLRSQVPKVPIDTVDLFVFLAHLGTTSVKALLRTLVKLSPGR